MFFIMNPLLSGIYIYSIYMCVCVYILYMVLHKYLLLKYCLLYVIEQTTMIKNNDKYLCVHLLIYLPVNKTIFTFNIHQRFPSVVQFLHH